MDASSTIEIGNRTKVKTIKITRRLDNMRQLKAEKKYYENGLGEKVGVYYQFYSPDWKDKHWINYDPIRKEADIFINGQLIETGYKETVRSGCWVIEQTVKLN